MLSPVLRLSVKANKLNHPVFRNGDNPMVIGEDGSEPA